MPTYENGSLAIVWCHRCESPQEQWRSDDGDRFSARCECTDFEVSGLTQSPNGPTTGAVVRPEMVRGSGPAVAFYRRSARPALAGALALRGGPDLGKQIRFRDDLPRR
jgi:hypothetical protein